MPSRKGRLEMHIWSRADLYGTAGMVVEGYRSQGARQRPAPDLRDASRRESCRTSRPTSNLSSRSSTTCFPTPSSSRRRAAPVIVRAGIEQRRRNGDGRGAGRRVPGLSEEDQSELYGKFARLSARPTGGESSSGLGLSIVKRPGRGDGRPARMPQPVGVKGRRSA